MKASIFMALLLFSFALQAQQKPVTRKVVVYTTEKNSSNKITKAGELTFKPFSQPLETQPCIFLDASKTFQTFVGIGGALTDASAETYAKLSPEKQKEFMTAYYDKEKGIGYTLGRTHINSCDFSSDSYVYIQESDESLKTFNIAHDQKFRIPFIKQAIAAAGGKLTMYVSPWSPPAFMKDNKDVLHGGKLLPEFRQAWANYYIKFIQEYEKQGIPIWGLTVQNEPMAKQTWESCIYSAEEERDFIKLFLGPTLAKNGMGTKKLIAWDHNRDLMYHRASTILNDPQAAKFVWGIGYHWYETWTGDNMQFSNEKKVAEAFPDKNLIFTEGCKEKFDLTKVDDWTLGERYGNSLINDFNSGTVAWTDWNILLDETGGPNHVGNFCFAPVHANTKTGELIYTNAYYYLGHFSKFIVPGAKRIVSSSSRDLLQSTAFKNPDGKIVVVVMNNSDGDIPFNIWLNGTGAETVSKAHSINTYVVE